MCPPFIDPRQPQPSITALEIFGIVLFIFGLLVSGVFIGWALPRPW